MLKKVLIEFFTYNLVGVINTLVGFSIIFLLMFLGLGALESNFIGYFLGAILSYNLNKRYTFKNTQNSKKQIVKFFAVLALAYLLNFITLQWLLGFLNPYLAQLISAVVYTLSSFILAKLVVFKND